MSIEISKKEISELSDKKLEAQASYALQWLEKAYQEAAERTDELAGDDRCGTLAECALEFKGIKRGLQQLHCQASITACKVLGTPMTRGGER